MNLFNNKIGLNLLPFDGEALHFGKIMSAYQAEHYFDELLKNIQWEHDKALIFGKLIYTKRKVAWYGDKAFAYTYSKTTKKALPWSNALLELKEIVEKQCGERFNSCLLNLYHNGEEGMAWHSDGEKDLKKNGAIGSLSLGACRKFAFKHKETKKTVSVDLESGSLLLMKGCTQTHWWHRLPPSKKVKKARINLTFRTIVDSH
ncbi:alpha-ketoglutarate-dependent dioxygenase AlkB [Marinilongibacter aquaticus]|uniref:alpha-ketoglutarate-dependent dioxygenase AlkB family protein n=1 Tax=Marinilongibacter aquaticus TaxID=2975157 RepID=UPI0021BD5753|nr:alpha-ketoglutarate-dependent dioxygenase AlkB [Marinilongibacter aquaticus]UBM59510.1 alpha-ketoglutarate-dependent dioxygenase AlkB [Marinilongibacter aquaticus]